MDSTLTISSYLERILDEAHPLMAEALLMAAVPAWYNPPLLLALRQQDDLEKNGRLAERMTRYSFITTLDGAEALYMVRPEERAMLQQRWIAKDPQAYRTAHRRALAYWQTAVSENPYAQAQNCFYHHLFVDLPAALDELLALFRTYRQERQLEAIARLLETAVSARIFLALLNEPLDEFDHTLAHLHARLAQLRGHWQESLSLLEPLRQKPGLSPRLCSLVERAYGHALAQTGQFVQAMNAYEQALAQFARQKDAQIPFGSVAAEKAHTLIALGDAQIGLALTARETEVSTAVSATWLQKISHLFYFFLSLPLLIYLTRSLGWRVWRPRFWPTLRGLDWMIARLFALGARAYKAADQLLEQHGTPAEGVAADERLANLYLAVGDAGRARGLFVWLLQQTEAPLGDYRRAVAQVGLGEALLRLGQEVEAQQQLATAVPLLTLYEDPDLLARAELLLAAAWEKADSLQAAAHYRRAQSLYLQQNHLPAATQVNERLCALAQSAAAPAGLKDEAAAAVAALPARHYRARYRHPITAAFQRLVIMLLAFFLFLIPLSIIRLDTGSVIEPEVTFNATPLLQQNNPNFVPDLSQGIAALNLAAPPNPRVLGWLGLGIVSLYLALTTALGLFSIARTPLADVQAAAAAETVRLDANGLAVGQRAIPWHAVTGIVQADVRLLRERLLDNAVTAVFTPQQPPLRISGSTAWYESIQQRIKAQLPPNATRADLGYSLLRSRLGAWYGLSLLLLLSLAVMGTMLPQLVLTSFLGPYSLADLYPYLYLGLFVPPLIWFVLRPLAIARRVQPTSRLPLWIIGVGLVLALLRFATLFRPWLTVPDIYPTLAVLLLLGSGALAVWRARENGTAVYGMAIRLGATVLALAALLLLGGRLLRAITAYHFLVLGHSHRNQTLALADSTAEMVQLKAAIAAYSRAMEITGGPQAGLWLPGIPQPLETTWLAAASSRAAVYAQSGQYAAAVADYSRVLAHTNDPGIIVSRAIAYMGLGTRPGLEGEPAAEVYETAVAAAIADFNQAISQEPKEALFLLWRGVAHHALSGQQPSLAAQAQADYAAALAISGPGALDKQGQAEAWLGQGWLAYARKEYETAVEYFQRAVAAAQALETVKAAGNKTAVESLLGLGYAYYSLRQYDAALEAWRQATDLNEELSVPYPAVPISLGTLYWRVATLGDDYEAGGVDRCQMANLPDAEKEQEAQNLEASLAAYRRALEVPGQDDAARAFTYRTMGQVTYLLRDCPGYDKEQVLKNAYGEYEQAVALAPNEAGYWFRKSRLAYAVWTLPGVPNEWLEQAIADMGGAIAAAPETAVYWHDRAWMSYQLWQYSPTDAGITARRWLFAGLADIEQALSLDATERDNSYRPNYWQRVIRSEAIDGTLGRGDRWFKDGAYATALDYYVLVAENVPENAAAALRASLAASRLGERETAVFWYNAGVERAAAAGLDANALLKELEGQLDDD